MSAIVGLGGLCYHGESVAENRQRAKYWYKKAADAGNIAAKDWLAKHSQ
jgi:TPR repeat protein